MAMMISKFNSLIRSRLLWGLFLVVIVLSFVVWGMPSCSRTEQAADRTGAQGVLDGEEIGNAEYDHAYMGAYIDVLVQYGQDAQRTEQFRSLVRQMAWQRLALQRQAKAWGIVATKAEVQQAIAANFADANGLFNRDIYDAFVQARLVPSGITVGQFEAYLAEQLVQQKVRMVVVQQAVVSPLEIRQAFSTFMDRYTADYAVVEAAPIDAALAITDDDARAAYDADPSAFDFPERRVATYVTFDPAAFADTGQAFDDAEVEDYYNEHLEEFQRTVAADDGTTSAEDIPFDEARDDVLAALRRNAALERAENAANTFATAVLPARDGTIPVFGAVAQEKGLATSTTLPFAQGDSPVPAAGAVFVAEAFSRDLGAYDAISDAILGTDGLYYILHLDEIQAPRTPAFEEVAAAANIQARAAALEKALAEKAAAARDAVQKALAGGATFASAASAAGLVAVSPDPFTGLEAFQAEDAAVRALSDALGSCNVGELTEPFAVPGGLAFGLLREREAADEAANASEKDALANIIRQQRAQSAFDDFLSKLLAPERFTDLHPVAEVDEDAEELSDEDVDAAAAAEEAAED